jgi:serine/threonine protein kinase
MSEMIDDLSTTRVGSMLGITLDAALAEQLAPTSLRRLGETRPSVLPQVAQEGGALRLLGSGGPRYAPVRTLGRGGMGEVELVEDRDIGRPVAVKRLLPEAGSAHNVARFAEEVRTIGRLEHPNILPIHDVGLDAEGRYFFVMKYFDGETLESIITRLRRADPEAVAQYDIPRRIEIFIGILRALEFAHSRGILHRDIKPGNVMVGRHGEVVLMDWGVAGPIRGAGTEVHAEPAPGPTTSDDRLWTTRVGDLVGTPYYMSPEQAIGRNQSLDQRSDLYSACVLLHELLGLVQRHGHHTSLMAVLMAVHRSEAPPSMTAFAPHPAQPNGVPAEYHHLIHRGLQRDPDRRWQSAGELIDELEAIQRGACRVQCPVTFSKRMVGGINRFLDRRRMAGAMIVLGSAVVALGAVVALVVQALR